MAAPSPYDVELLLAAELAEITDETERAIFEAWLLAWSEISADLLETLTTILAAGARVTAATVVRSERLASTLAAVADKLDDLAEAAGVTIGTTLTDVLDQAVDGTAELLAAQVDGSSANEAAPTVDVDLDRRPTMAALDAIVERTTEQITSTLTPIADETYVLVQRELIRGVAAGDNPRETAQRMVDRAENQWNFGRSRAVNVARTETLDAYRAGAKAAQDTQADVLAGWVWLAHLGARTCRSCLSMHGTLHDLDVEGPKDHQQGRCARVGVVKPLDPDAEPDLSWVPDAEAHFETLPAEDQRRLLGRDGYRAWLAGDFPREAWTKTRSTDEWRDSQIPAKPGDTDGGSGRDDPPPGAPDAPAGDREPTESRRDRALRVLGDPPDDLVGDDGKAYREQRRDLLDEVNFGDDTVDLEEIEFVERFLDHGEQLEWIPRGANGYDADGSVRSTNDFVWTSNGGVEVELKSPRVPVYTNARRLIMDAVKGARSHGVVKDHFIVDFGDSDPGADVFEQLGQYNLDRVRYPIQRLWAAWDDQLVEIDLQT